MTDKGWMTCESAAAYLDFGTGRKAVRAFREWARTKGVNHGNRGRRPLYHRLDLDAAIGAGHRRDLRIVRSAVNE